MSTLMRIVLGTLPATITIAFNTCRIGGYIPLSFAHAHSPVASYCRNGGFDCRIGSLGALPIAESEIPDADSVRNGMAVGHMDVY